MVREFDALSPPTFYFSKLEVAIINVATGNNQEALRDLQVLEGLWKDETVEPHFLAITAYLYSRIDQPTDAQRLFKRLEAMAPEYTVGPGTWGLAFLAIGDQGSSLKWFNQAADQKGYDDSYGVLFQLSVSSFRDPVLEQPEFIEVRKRMGPRYSQ